MRCVVSNSLAAQQFRFTRVEQIKPPCRFHACEGKGKQSRQPPTLKREKPHTKKAHGFKILNPKGSDLCERRLRFFNDGCKRLWLVHGQVGQDFTVHFDAGKGQAVDELAVC